MFKLQLVINRIGHSERGSPFASSIYLSRVAFMVAAVRETAPLLKCQLNHVPVMWTGGWLNSSWFVISYLMAGGAILEFVSQFGYPDDNSSAATFSRQ